MQLKKLHCLILLASSITITVYSQTQKKIPLDSLEFKIKKVENSLSPLISIKGEKLWNIKEQMHAYNIPGLSVAIIKDYKIEWAKGYGTVNSSKKQRSLTKPFSKRHR